MTTQQPDPSSNPGGTGETAGQTSEDVPIDSGLKERETAEEALRQSEARLRLLIESATDYAIFTIDPTGIINGWNTGAERIFGWTEEEALGQPAAIIFTPEDRAAKAHETEMKTARETGRALDERYHLRKDGSRFYVSGSLSALYNNNNLEGYVKIARDLSERKQMEEALEERVQERTRELYESEAKLRRMASRLTMAEQEERRRISQILHDNLQQLLYGIQLKMEFVRDGLKSGQHEGLVDHTEDTAAWLQDAIDMTRRLTVDLSPPVLQGEGLADALAWLVTQMADLYGLRVEVEASHSFPLDDPDMRVLLFQIIRELLFNVVKHAGTNQARVSLHEERGRLIIQVSDRGRGFKVATVEASPEVGFGLFSIRERLALFGGRLKLVSRPGEGTQATIRIPLKLKKK